MLYCEYVVKRDSRSKGINGVISLQAKLGATIKLWRTRLGITQEELAWRSDMHRTYIADIERGGRNITLRSIANLAAALQVSVENLLGHTEEGGNGSLDGINGHAPTEKAMGEVLLVEDDPADVDITLWAFKRAKFANPVRVVRDGKEALDFLFGTATYTKRKGAPLPHLVLLDLNLPKIQGMEVLRRIKAHELTRSIPVVVLTASKQDKNIIECGRLGAANYIVKPVNFENFCKVASKFSLRLALMKTDGHDKVVL